VIEECLETGQPVRRRAVRIVAGSHDAPRRHRVLPSEPSRRPHGAICLFTDLTDIVELEEQLRLKDSLAVES
jgi:hypothetical protein